MIGYEYLGTSWLGYKMPLNTRLLEFDWKCDQAYDFERNSDLVRLKKKSGNWSVSRTSCVNLPRLYPSMWHKQGDEFHLILVAPGLTRVDCILTVHLYYYTWPESSKVYISYLTRHKQGQLPKISKSPVNFNIINVVSLFLIVLLLWNYNFKSVVLCDFVH